MTVGSALTGLAVARQEKRKWPAVKVFQVRNRPTLGGMEKQGSGTFPQKCHYHWANLPFFPQNRHKVVTLS